MEKYGGVEMEFHTFLNCFIPGRTFKTFKIILEDTKPIMLIPRIEPRFPVAHPSDHSFYTIGRLRVLSENISAYCEAVRTGLVSFRI